MLSSYFGMHAKNQLKITFFIFPKFSQHPNSEEVTATFSIFSFNPETRSSFSFFFTNKSSKCDVFVALFT